MIRDIIIELAHEIGFTINGESRNFDVNGIACICFRSPDSISNIEVSINNNSVVMFMRLFHYDKPEFTYLFQYLLLCDWYAHAVRECGNRLSGIANSFCGSTFIQKIPYVYDHCDSDTLSMVVNNGIRKLTKLHNVREQINILRECIDLAEKGSYDEAESKKHCMRFVPTDFV